MFNSILNILIRATVIAAVLIGSAGFIGNVNAAPPDFGDLIILLRNDSGVPIPSASTQVPDPETGILVDGGLCWQPIAFSVDDELACPTSCQVTTTTPATVSVDQFNCAVTTGCSGCTQEVDFGRINEARSPETVFESQLEDVVVNLATADCRTLDPAGRLVASRVDSDLGVLVSTIDSPLQNLAIYRQLMLTGTIGTALPEGAGTLDTAARGLGAASDKTGEVNVDLVAYLNQIMGLSDPLTSTILPKLCETYREEVQGTIQLVQKCYLDYGQVPPDLLAYNYDRTANFLGLPSPAYIPADNPMDGWFEYLVLLSQEPPTFGIEQGPILDAVFGTASVTGSNIGGFALASDDTRSVISFMHENQVPVDFETPVPCIPDSTVIAYDVLISEESGLQVPRVMVDGLEGREFIVTVANASGSADPASGTVTVTAIAASGGIIEGSPWTFEFTDLAVGASQSFTQFFSIDLGERTRINWEAVAAAEFDVNLSNNTVTETTRVWVIRGDDDDDDDDDDD